MPAFRRVEDRRAGPTALGILVPPGGRTLVILRPRALEWDLLPLHEGGPAFCEFGRDEAAGVARRVQRALETSAGGRSPVCAVKRPDGDGHQVQVVAGEWTWVVCRRVPGEPYRAAVFATLEAADAAVACLAPFLCPAMDAGQEYYFNTQNFQSVRFSGEGR